MLRSDAFDLVEQGKYVSHPDIAEFIMKIDEGYYAGDDYFPDRVMLERRYKSKNFDGNWFIYEWTK